MKLPDIVQRELDTIPGRWSAEMGRRHIHIRVDGRLVGILRRGSDNEAGRAALNTRAQIRRAAAGREA